MLSYKEEKQDLTKKLQGVLHFTYQTKGEVDLETVRENIPHFQTVNLILPPTIVLPYVGVHDVKVHIDNHWYQAIATISEMVCENVKNKKMIKLYISHFDGTIRDSNVTVLWGDHTGEYVKYV